jgi:threonine dehydrogenase-like Zn-dependent dehydrogenase
VDEIAAFFIRNRLPLDKLVSERIGIEDAPRAFEVYDRHETPGKIMFLWD